ncbi:TIGR03086 family metal-binding protein [Saccharopolyspora sp. TS4A08]|uniref:TIGR03086 family metal-binding protein n=1 Tax=Saccharopolyspora ipomoeae TaxID=3042027 RepID=A0ABT6PVK7_9PSEU|nr:TIGR03086 family metal-binding protein [Saccharopolyspora sp. TS4A08]MDI2032045.1 TIGR03086 family metal-binding protein [Saccharopolyspora sp. TS4A08]
MSELNAVVGEALELFVDAVERVPEGSWDEPSILDEWSVRELVGHVTGSATKVALLLEGGETWQTPSEPADWVCPDPASRLREIGGRIERALPGADLESPRPSPAGEVPLRQAVAFPVADLAMHAWDLRRSCGGSAEFSEGLLRYCQGLIDSVPEEMMRGKGGFAPATTPPATATPTDRLMAHLGRSAA